MYKELTDKIKAAYEQDLTVQDAERLAAEFLYAQILVGGELRKVDLDARMKKSGQKALKAAVYMDSATKTDKKPSDSFLQALVDMDQLVVQEQNSLDEAEVNRDELENYRRVFAESHIFFRGVAKGRFE